jgi:GH24 family phage-related lysozyme (muramidase)
MIEAFEGTGDHIGEVNQMLIWTTEESLATGVNIAQVEIPQILKDFYLENCRVTYWPDTHLKPRGKTLYAYDIACERGKSFDVKAPSINDWYLLLKKWYDNNLWNYIILDYDSTHILFGHTTTQLKEWDHIDQWAIIGNTDRSGDSRWIHLHIEIWRNYSWEWTNTEYPKRHHYWPWYWDLVTNPDSKYILDKRREYEQENKEVDIYPKWWATRWEVERIATDLITRFEWLQLQAYHDSKQRSIWYGTISYEWEIITADEAWSRFNKELKPRINKVWSEYEWSSNQVAALVSLLYNCPSCYKRVVSNPTKSLWLAHNKQCVWKSCIILWWLTKRRAAEWNLFEK